MQTCLAESVKEIEECFPVMVQLRTTLTKEEFVERVTNQQKDGYKLVSISDNNKVIAVAGFRYISNLFSGKVLYVDDFITDEKSRSKGYGGQLFDWIIEYAKKENCKSLLLDSGVQRFGAHKFYMKKGMHISSYHFVLPLVESKVKKS